MANYDRLLVPQSLLTRAGLLAHLSAAQSSSHRLAVRRQIIPSSSLSAAVTLSENRRELEKVDPRHFEELIAELLKADGYEVHLIPRLNMPGPDIIAFCSTPSGDRQCFVVECKRWAKPVGIDIVRSMVYRIDHEFKASGGMLVTSSRFTSEARQEVERLHRWRLHLKDGGDVQRWIAKHSRAWSVSEVETEISARVDETILLNLDQDQRGLVWIDVIGPVPCQNCGGVIVCGRRVYTEVSYDDMGVSEGEAFQFHVCLSCMNSEHSFESGVLYSRQCPHCSRLARAVGYPDRWSLALLGQ